MEFILAILLLPFILIYHIFKWILQHIFHKKVNRNSNLFEDKYAYYPEDLRSQCELDDKYENILATHFKYLEKIGMLYTVANNLSLPNSPQMQKVIDLCLKDIALAPQVAEYFIQEANLNNQDIENALPTYPSFQRLAIIYEKQEEYEKAIDICKQAIELGFYKDGTSGQMPGRLARLIKKLNKQNIQLEQ